MDHLCSQMRRPRPTYDPAAVAVQHRLRGDLSDVALRGVLAALRADPAWVVLEPFDRPPEHIVQMVYRPTGTPYAFRAKRVQPGRWRFANEPGGPCRYSPYEAGRAAV